jgi:hypothetical protein
MKRVTSLFAIVWLGIGSASATLTDPGAPVDSANHTYTLLDDSLPQGNEGPPNVTSSTLLDAPVFEGFLVLGEHGLPNLNDRSTWSDVIHFYNTSDFAKGIADLYSWDDFSSFPRFSIDDAVVVMAEAVVPGSEDPNYHGGNYTIYIAPQDPSSPFHNTYNIESVVPEPSTYLAGALLLVPFGMSTLRVIRKRPTA